MNCNICCKKIDLSDLLRCNGCKATYHYRCMKITPAEFKEGPVQLKRTFKCDICTNVSKRIRVTDDTPVRGAPSAIGIADEINQSFEDSVSKDGLLTSEQKSIMTGIMEKVTSVLMAKLNDIEICIMDEIKANVTVLTSENSKLRQELKEANEKCMYFEQEIRSLKTEKQTITKDKQRQSVALPGSGDTTESSSSSAGSVNDSERGSHESRSQATEPVVSYAAVVGASAAARKTADYKDSEIENKPVNTWTEIKRIKKQNPIKKGGNTSTLTLKAVERKKYLHVWRLAKDTTEDDLMQYIRNVLGDDTEITVEKVKQKIERNYASFKIGVTKCNYEKLCDAEVWPLNVEYCEWIWFRFTTKPTLS